MHYIAKVKKENGFYLVAFPDFPNINTYGETKEEALRNAEEALNGAIESDYNRNFDIPTPSKIIGKDYYPVYVESNIKIAYILRQIRKEKSQHQIAKELGITYQTYQKLENPRKCNPTIKTLERIAKAYNKRIDVSIL